MKELVLLIHGTNSSDPSDTGSIWWQRGSDLTTKLGEVLGDSFECQPAGHVFHWSGANSEKERRAAARELAKWLTLFEGEGRLYHLIGHSHGGSVIWHALRGIVASGGTLSALRTWATVGTPFLHFIPSRISWWLIVPVIATAAGGAIIAPQVVTYAQVIFHALNDPGGSRYPLLGLPLLWMIPLTVLAALLLRLAAFAGAWRQCRRECTAAKRAYDALWRRYAGFWCDIDEAIGGLAGTLTIPAAIVPRMRSVAASRAKRVLATLATPLRGLYNAFVARASDEFIWDRISSRLQGSDRYAYHLSRVTRGPLPSVAPWPELPEDVSGRIIATANRFAASTLAKVRNVVGLAAEATPGRYGFVAGVSESLSSRELVHNLYFGDDGFVELLRQHITGQPQHEWLSLGRETTDPVPTVASDDVAPQPRWEGLAAIQALAATALVALAWLSSSLMFDFIVRPHVPRVQVERIVGQNLAASIISGPDISDYTLHRWAAVLTRAGFPDRAVATAAELEQSESALVMMASVAHEHLQNGQRAKAKAVLDKALEIAAQNEPGLADDGFISLAEELAHAGRAAEALQVVDEMAGDVDDFEADGLVAVSSGHVDAGRLSAATTTLDNIADPELRASRYRELMAYAENEKVKRALLQKLEQLAPTVPDKGNWQSGALAAVANEYVEIGNLSRAAKLAETIKHPAFRAGALTSIARAYVNRGKPQDARRFIELALVAQPSGNLNIATILSDLHDLRRARTMLDAVLVQAQRTTAFREDAIGAVAEGWAYVGDVRRTVDILGALQLGFYKSSVFAHYSTAMKQLADDGKATETDRAVRKVNSKASRCFLLIALAQVADEAQRPPKLLEAESIARTIADEEDRSFALAEIAKEWVKLRQYRYAIQISDASRAFDRMDVHTTIVEHYAVRVR